MRTTLVTALTALTLATGPAPAHAQADMYSFEGGCGFFAVNDLAGGSEWRGEIDIRVVARDAWTWAPVAVPVTVECEFSVLPAAPSIVHSASGTGVVVDVAEFSYTADPDEIVVMCTIVTIGDETHRDQCGSELTRPLVPPAGAQAVDDAATLAGETLCASLVALDGGPADQPPVDIRSDGDLYVAGEWIWDCPWHRPVSAA